MKRIGVNKRNPNPPWPSEQPVVVIPPGSSSAAIGMHEEPVRQMSDNEYQRYERTDGEEMSREMHSGNAAEDGMAAGDLNNAPDENRRAANAGAAPYDVEREFPIMGFQTRDGAAMPNGCMNAVGVNGYLCGHVGRYVKIEFIFGEQTHIEKTGILRNVGQNFVVIREMGSENDIVCAINRIKFITIYNMNGGMNLTT